MCRRHTRQWDYAGRPDLAAWQASPAPLPPLACPPPACRIGYCSLWAQGTSAFCASHDDRWKAGGCPTWRRSSPPARTQALAWSRSICGACLPSDLREHLQAAGHAAVIKPPPLRQVIPGGFTIDDFTVDDQAGTVTCPAGQTVTLGRPQGDGSRRAQFKARCRGCPLRERCTTSKTGRVLTVHPQHALLAAARRAAADPAWQDEYRRWRPPVERAIAWLVARGNRRVPYRGVSKNNIWLHNRAAALNLRRLVNLGLTRAGDGAWVLA